MVKIVPANACRHARTVMTKPLDVLDSLAAEYVLPSPPRGASELVVVPTRAEPFAGLRRGGDVARAIGDRFVALTECQQQFLAELRERLGTLDAAIAEDSRARLKGALRDAFHVLDWCDAVQSDLQTDGRRAAAGAEPIDVAALCGEVAAATGAGDAVQVAGRLPGRWWGEASALATVLDLGLRLVSERTGGLGRRFLELGGDGEQPTVRIVSYADPAEGVDPASVRRFRQAVERLGARVVPDALGPGGSGFLLLLPLAPA